MNKSLLEKLLDYYHISYEDYLHITREVNLSSFKEGHDFDDIDKAVDIVKEVIANNGKIIIYGDYDADGVMGTSILVKMFQYLDVVVSYYIPNRYKDGYGLTLSHAQEYVASGFNLVITVDNGISAFEPIDYLINNGVKVLVLDHHQVQDTVPNANAICHPTYTHFGETASSGAFTAFVFSIALLGRIDKYLATLAAISLISDMMPLVDYNRDLLRAVFKDYRPFEFSAVDLLADHDPIDETVIGMKIAPRINSIGRLCDDESINQIVNYFTTDDEEFILNYYSYILDMNELRKNLSKEVAGLSLEDIKEAIVIKGEYKEGIIGLIANSLVNKYHVPCVVFTRGESGSLKGSARAPEGFDIIKVFNALSNLMFTYGGHALAGGCSISEENFELFKEEFIKLSKDNHVEYVPVSAIEVSFNEINLENYELIKSFSPFGESWESPLLKISHIKTSTLTFSRDEKHILTSVGFSLRLIGFNFSKEEVLENDYVDLIGELKKNSYKGKTYLEFNIKKVEPHN